MLARRARGHYPGAVYHVMLRGNGGHDIFFDDSDRIRFYDLLEEGVKRFDARIPALCLMTNQADRIGGGYGEEFHSGTRGGRIFRDDRLAEDALRRADEKMKRRVSVEEVATHVSKRYGLEPAALADPGKKRNGSEPRARTALLVWYQDHLSLTDLCTRLDRDLSSLSQAVNHRRKRAATNPRLAAELERVREELAQIQICQAF